MKLILLILVLGLLVGCAHVRTPEEETICILHGVCPTVDELK